MAAPYADYDISNAARVDANEPVPHVDENPSYVFTEACKRLIFQAQATMIDKTDYTDALRRLVYEYPEEAEDVDHMMRALGDEPVDLTTDMLNMVRNNLRLELHAAMPHVKYKRIKSWAY